MMNSSLALDTPLQFVKGIGPKQAILLQKLNLFTVQDLVFFFPRRYDDRRHLPKLAELKSDTVYTTVGVIVSVEAASTSKKGKTLLKAVITDGTARLTVVWFNQPFLKNLLKSGTWILIRGKLERNMYRELEFWASDTECAPAYSAQKELGLGQVMPVYSLTHGLFQKKVRDWVSLVVHETLPLLEDPLPSTLLETLKFPSLAQSVLQLHFPTQGQAFIKARNRMAFEECFLFQCTLAQKRTVWQITQKTQALQAKGPLLEAYIKGLPYTLTSSQQQAIATIQNDVSQTVAMNRLLQGDVGSGKTEVAVTTLLMAIQSHKKAAIMAPTEILAEQHYLKFKTVLEPMGIEVLFLKGKLKQKEKKALYERLTQPAQQVIVGTHALIQDNVAFNNLGAIVVDEQHRFGVVQRALLQQKGTHPHCLFMSATPIPRTFMLTCYGDLHKTIMTDIPPGRSPIKTLMVPEDELPQWWAFAQEKLKEGRQMYVVYPLVEDSEKLDLKSAEEGLNHLTALFPNFKVGLIHGKLPAIQKEAMMAAFKAKQIHILVGTTVIEVGIDVPNATLMVVQHAERFGLAQLHQLRGRVGRGPLESFCCLVANPKTEAAQKRIHILLETTDGFKIAEQDVAIRGPGDVLGTRQSGFPNFRVFDITSDENILLGARKWAFSILKKDPHLLMPEHQPIKRALSKKEQAVEKLGFH